MKAVEFNYRKEKLRTGEIIYRPVAKAYLFNTDDEWIPEFFYVDSGADYTLIPYRMGRFLGLEKIAGDVKEIGGIGGIIGVRFAIRPMKIGRHCFDCSLAWAQIEHVPFLLGRASVFDHFKIIFQQKAKKVTFVWDGNV